MVLVLIRARANRETEKRKPEIQWAFPNNCSPDFSINMVQMPKSNLFLSMIS